MHENGQINISFPDGNTKVFEAGATPFEIAKSISNRLADDVLVAEFNDNLIDLNKKIYNDGKLKLLKFDDDKGRHVYWHTSSHIMAQAIEELFPGAKFGVGPAIDEGFYYDVDTEHKFTDEDLKKIEDRMVEISKRDLKPVREELKREDAIKYFRTKRVDPYKVEILEDIAKDEEFVSLYHQGEFTDLCRGPHLPTTSKIKYVKLLNVSGSYWRGDSNRQMLQRIYGITFPKKKDLDEYLFIKEEQRKRDHRKIGRELELFFFNEISPGAPFWLPNGMIIFKELERVSRKLHDIYGYQEVSTPIVVKDKLFATSGHLDHYTDNMFRLDMADENENYYLKPMNCPEATMIYSSKLRSYRDLPIRLFEIGRLHRNEISGALGGMLRVRQLTMDDAHIFCTEEQIQEEITRVIELVKKIYSLFDFSPEFHLSTRPDEAMGSVESWDKAEAALSNALKANEIDFQINEKDGAFYGPKIDIHIKDSLKRSWQMATIQLDAQMPERFDLTYEGKDGTKHRPIMIHRAIFGSFERFLGIITEHLAGNFPFWIAPVQLAVLPISENHSEYAKDVYDKLVNAGFRVMLDNKSEKIGYKIREAETRKIPYMVIVGENEKKNNTISVRVHKKGDIGSYQPDEFIKKLESERTIY